VEVDTCKPGYLGQAKEADKFKMPGDVEQIVLRSSGRWLRNCTVALACYNSDETQMELEWAYVPGRGLRVSVYVVY